MKKFGLFVALFLIIFFSGEVLGACVDSDGGTNLLIGGCANDNCDSCYSDTWVREWRCVSGFPDDQLQSCPTDHPNCIKAEPSEGDYCSACYDSDNGQTPMVLGYAKTLTGSPQWDYCSGTKVREYYCTGDIVTVGTLDCPAGYSCSGGVCVNAPTCSDPDNTPYPIPTTAHSSFLTRTTVTNSAGSVADACYDGLTLFEQACNSNGVDVNVASRNCQTVYGTGYTCQNGACVTASSCTCPLASTVPCGQAYDDNCGNPCGTGTQCGAGTQCNGVSCVGSSCVPVSYSYSCFEGNLYRTDNCGNTQLAQTCAFGCNSGVLPNRCNDCALQSTCCPNGLPVAEGTSCGITEYSCSSGKDACGDSILSRTLPATCSSTGTCVAGSGSGSWTPTSTICDGTKYCVNGSATCSDCTTSSSCATDFSCVNGATGEHECLSTNTPAGEFCEGGDCSNPRVCDGLGACTSSCGGENQPCCGVGANACTTPSQCTGDLICSDGICASCAVEQLRWEQDGDVLGSYFALNDDDSEKNIIQAVVRGNPGCGPGAKVELTIYEDNNDIDGDEDIEFDSGHLVKFDWDVEDYSGSTYYFKSDLSGELKSPNITIVEDCRFYFGDVGQPYQITSCDDYNELDSNIRELSCKSDCAEVVAYEAGAHGENGLCAWGVVNGTSECFFKYLPFNYAGDADFFCKTENLASSECGADDAFRAIEIKTSMVNTTTNAITENKNLCPGSCGESICEVQVPCPKVVELPFFSTVNVIAVVVILIFIYIVVISTRKKKRKTR